MVQSGSSSPGRANSNAAPRRLARYMALSAMANTPVRVSAWAGNMAPPSAALITRAVLDENEQARLDGLRRSEEHTSELQSLMRSSYAVFCLKKKTQIRHKEKVDY